MEKSSQSELSVEALLEATTGHVLSLLSCLALPLPLAAYARLSGNREQTAGGGVWQNPLASSLGSVLGLAGLCAETCSLRKIPLAYRPIEDQSQCC